MSFLKKFTETAVYNAYSRAISIDFTIGKIYFFQPKLIDIIESFWGITIEQMMIENRENTIELESCITELIQKNIMFISNKKDVFPDIIYNELSYSEIENIHIIFKNSKFKNLEIIVDCIDLFKIKASKFNFKNCNKLEIVEIIQVFTHSKLESIECVFDYILNEIDSFFLEELISINGAITSMKFANLPENFQFENILHVDLLSEDIHYPKFTTSFNLFTESQKFNTYLNKKLFIGENEEIKNALESDKIFGYLDKLDSIDDLKEIIKSSQFQKFWNISKDLIDICKDCEFRHICVDNRIPHQRLQGGYYQINECNFNPYITKWINEEGYQSLQECGVISNEKGFSIDHEKIAKINALLWDEEEVEAE